MKTQLFRVVFSANKESGDMPSYSNGYEAFDENGYKWATLNNPGPVFVLEKQVRSESATGACLKMQKWQETGKPGSWLLSEFSFTSE